MKNRVITISRESGSGGCVIVGRCAGYILQGKAAQTMGSFMAQVM